MLKKFACMLLLTCAVALPPPMPVGAQQVAPSEVFEGSCDVKDPIKGEWDVWYEIVVVKGNGWFPTHVHDGIECVTTVKGVGQWWTADNGGTTNRVPTKETFLVRDLLVHTGGNIDHGEMHYLSTHVMRAGAPFRDVCTAMGAPKSAIITSSNPFKQAFWRQEGLDGPFKVKQSIKTLPPGASDTVHSDAPAYIAAVDGALTLKSGNDTRTLPPGEGFLVAAGTTVMVGNAAEGNARLAILEVTAL